MPRTKVMKRPATKVMKRLATKVMKRPATKVMKRSGALPEEPGGQGARTAQTGDEGPAHQSCRRVPFGSPADLRALAEVAPVERADPRFHDWVEAYTKSVWLRVLERMGLANIQAMREEVRGPDGGGGPDGER